ncbi:hypothetical protein ZWY2020_002720 [Hordeum vulgare]|nr:hypothetical protein ZWY2020_002720 [Hordeum vulgare]
MNYTGSTLALLAPKATKDIHEGRGSEEEHPGQDAPEVPVVGPPEAAGSLRQSGRWQQRQCLGVPTCGRWQGGVGRARGVLRRDRGAREGAVRGARQVRKPPPIPGAAGRSRAEYGFADCVGPLELPCAVDDFMEVMWEMEQAGGVASPRCSRFAGWGHHHHQQHHGYHMLSPGIHARACSSPTTV